VTGRYLSDKETMTANLKAKILLFLLSLFLGASAAWAESTQQQGTSTQARLQFSVTIPTILYLQVGTEGATIDTVYFDVIGLPGSGAVEGYCSATYPVPVRVLAMVARNQRVLLTADSSNPLSNGTETIDFNNIRLVASGDFHNRRFNRHVNQNMAQWHGSGEYLGTYRFFYDNDEDHGPGIYHGQVTFTVSAP
jgi:hypothetical protein